MATPQSSTRVTRSMMKAMKAEVHSEEAHADTGDVMAALLPSAPVADAVTPAPRSTRKKVRR